MKRDSSTDVMAFLSFVLEVDHSLAVVVKVVKKAGSVQMRGSCCTAQAVQDPVTRADGI